MVGNLLQFNGGLSQIQLQSSVNKRCNPCSWMGSPRKREWGIVSCMGYGFEWFLISSNIKTAAHRCMQLPKHVKSFLWVCLCLCMWPRVWRRLQYSRSCDLTTEPFLCALQTIFLFCPVFTNTKHEELRAEYKEYIHVFLYTISMADKKKICHGVCEGNTT